MLEGGKRKRRAKWADMSEVVWGAMKEAVDKFGGLPDENGAFGDMVFKVIQECKSWSQYVATSKSDDLMTCFFSKGNNKERIWSVHWQNKQGTLIRQKVITPDGVVCRTYATFIKWLRHVQLEVAEKG